MGNFLDAISVNSANELNIVTAISQPNCEHLGEIQVKATGFYGQLEYEWSPIVSSNEHANNLQSGNYSITVTDELGCVLAVSVDLIEYHVDSIQIKDSICFNENYAFFDDNISMTGVYSHVIKNIDNCDSVVYILYLKRFDEQQLIVDNSTEYITFNHNDFDSYFFVSALDSIFNDSILVSNNYIDNFELHVFKNGCEQIVSLNSISAGEIIIPNVFTPNFDMLNDSFHLNGNYFGLIKLEIINRWGGKVIDFEGEFNDFKWFPQSNITDGTYFILIEYSGKKQQGFFQIVKD